MTLNDFIGLAGYICLNAAFGLCLLIIAGAALYALTRNDLFIRLIETLARVQVGAFALAVGALGALLQMDAFEYPLVFDAVETGMRWYEKLGGLWSGQANSLLAWSALLSGAAVLSIGAARRMSRREYIPAAAGILQFMLAFFVVPIIFFARPFERLWAVPGEGMAEAMFAPPGSSLIVPLDGLGMNPSLRHIAMLLHPPTLYLGLIGFFIPYAFALAALMIRDEGSEWVERCFGIAVGAWAFLTVGMFLGSWWAYTILGWGGYWGWDAVEISGLLPWLLSFGLVHSMRLRLRKGGAARWVYAFSLGITLFILFGVLLTRSGLIESVHAYSAGAMGPVLTALIGLNLLAALGLGAARAGFWRGDRSGEKRALSERLIGWFNIVIVLLVAVYLFGQTLPLTSPLIFGESRSFTPEQYVATSAPLLLALLVITGLCAGARLWESDRRKFWRFNTALAGIAGAGAWFFLREARLPLGGALGFWAAGYALLAWLAALGQALFRAGGPGARGWRFLGGTGAMLVHIGVGVLALGILGAENLEQSAELRMGMMDSAQTGFTKVQTLAIREERAHAGQTDYALEMKVMEGGREFSLTPVLEYFHKREMLHARPAIHSSAARDIQVVMTALPAAPDHQATLRVYRFPLMSWIWAGGALMALGGFIQLAGWLKRKGCRIPS